MRDGLHALVTAMPQIETVRDADEVTSALTMASAPSPELVLMESTPGGKDVWITVRRVKARWPLARCICLVNDVNQRQEAESAGADVVLLEGFPAGRLVAAIVRLLPQPVT
jgi:DNA-binding NarL/FixJ family response regulator